MIEHNVGTRVRQYFASKRQQLLAMRDQAICEHGELNGSHREEFQRIFLREILPKRFQIDRGMIYSQIYRSRQTDIVIWDAQNYPCLPLHGHSLYFAESVRAAIECKSTWSTSELQDVLEKTKEVRSIIACDAPNLADKIEGLSVNIC